MGDHPKKAELFKWNMISCTGLLVSWHNVKVRIHSPPIKKVHNPETLVTSGWNLLLEFVLIIYFDWVCMSYPVKWLVMRWLTITRKKVPFCSRWTFPEFPSFHIDGTEFLGPSPRLWHKFTGNLGNPYRWCKKRK